MTAEEALITYRGTIYPWQCDHMGHMNVMWYVGKFDEASWNLLAAAGLTSTYLREQNRGVFAAEQHLSYQSELLAGDTILVRSRVIEAREKVVMFVHEMFNAETETLAATARYVAVHVDRATRKSCPLPAHAHNAFLAFAARNRTATLSPER
jgi:acyl-CoA thioester hydrolase